MVLPLGITGLAEEFVSKVCSGHGPRPEGTHATGLAEFLCALALLVPVTPGVGTDVSSSDPISTLLQLILMSKNCSYYGSVPQ